MPEMPNPFYLTEILHPVRFSPTGELAKAQERLDQARLTAARRALLDARTNLALVRKRSDLGPFSRRFAEANFLHAVDRAWDAQCMASACIG